MTEIAIMIEGQDGLNWPRWQRLARAVDELGFAGLHRSDHFTNPQPPDLDSLPLWPSLTWVADHSERIKFGPLVTPASFRHPVHTARMAAAVDDLSGGRLVLGLGAGWQEREHEHYGFDLLEVDERFSRFEESLAVVTLLLKEDGPVEFAGEYYQLHRATLQPRPDRPGGPPILIGGNGPKYTLPLVARFADEWNGVFLTAEEFAGRNRQLDELLDDRGRPRKEVRRSVMTQCIFGRDEAGVRGQIRAQVGKDLSPEEVRRGGRIVGTANEIVAQIGQYAEAGAYKIMLQWLDQDDLDGLAALAAGVLPQVQP